MYTGSVQLYLAAARASSQDQVRRDYPPGNMPYRLYRMRMAAAAGGLLLHLLLAAADGVVGLGLHGRWSGVADSRHDEGHNRECIDL